MINMKRDTSINLPKYKLFQKVLSFSWLKPSMLVEIICSLFIILFVYAALSKLLDFHKFKVEIGKSPLLASIAGLVSITIPSIELLLSLFLAIPRYRLLGLYGAYSLMVSFTTYLIVVLNFSFYVPCTCGGLLQSMSWKSHIIFNCIFIFLAIMAIVMNLKYFNHPHKK